MSEMYRSREYLRIMAEARVALVFNPGAAGPLKDLRRGEEEEGPTWDIFPGVDKEWKA